MIQAPVVTWSASVDFKKVANSVCYNSFVNVSRTVKTW